jgi:hypothetical protein
MGIARLQQPIDLAQRVVTPAFRTEAVAAVTEGAFEDRFDHETDRLLDDAVLDRWDAQRPHPAIAFRNLDPFDGLRAVVALPQHRRQLQQIFLCLRSEPLHALPIHARRALVRLDLGPRHPQRAERIHLVDQRVPLASFDAVAQRRQHAFRPHPGFDPRPVSTGWYLCTLLSLLGTADAALPWHGFHASTFLPGLPSEGFCYPLLQRSLRTHSGTMRALTPAALHQRRRPLRSVRVAVPASRPQPRYAARRSRAYHLVSPVGPLRARLRHE